MSIEQEKESPIKMCMLKSGWKAEYQDLTSTLRLSRHVGDQITEDVIFDALPAEHARVVSLILSQEEGFLDSSSLSSQNKLALEQAVRADPYLYHRLFLVRAGKIQFNLHKVIKPEMEEKSAGRHDKKFSGEVGKRDEGGFPLMGDFRVKVKKARIPLPLFGIDFSKDWVPLGRDFASEKFLKDFTGSAAFLREAIFHFGEKNSVELIKYVSLYTRVEKISESDFAELSIIMLRAILGNGSSFVQVAELPAVKATLSSKKTQRQIEVHVAKSYYYWLSVFRQIYPDKPFKVSLDFERQTTYMQAYNSARLALNKAWGVITLANEIHLSSDMLSDLGISDLQQKMWFLALIGKERYLDDFTDNERKEFALFRLYAPSDLSLSLAFLHERLVLRDLPPEEDKRLAKLTSITSEFLLAINHIGKDWRNPQYNRQKICALLWFKKFRPSHRVAIMKSVSLPNDSDLIRSRGQTNVPYIEGLEESKVRLRKNMRGVIGPIRAMIIEYLGGKSSEEILKRANYKSDTVLTLMEIAEPIYQNHQSLFGFSLRRNFERICQKVRFNDYILSDQQILVLLAVKSRLPFNPYDFSKIFTSVLVNAFPYIMHKE